jgi:hypothetical protein
LGAFPSSQHFEGRSACWSSGMGLGRATNDSIIHADLHNPNKKLVSLKLEHIWCTDSTWANMDSQDSPWPGLGGSHHLPPYSIYMHGHGTSTQMSFCLGSLGIPKIRTIATLGAHNFVYKLSIEVRSDKKLYPSSLFINLLFKFLDIKPYIL